MQIISIITFAAMLTAQVNCNGRDQQQGPPVLPSYNCTYWEKQLNVTWREIRLPHAYDCTRFYECDGGKIVEKICAARDQTRYDPFQKVCNWNYIIKCILFHEYIQIVGITLGKV